MGKADSRLILARPREPERGRLVASVLIARRDQAARLRFGTV